MMENAAAALEKAVRDYSFKGTILILCGKGNNGGDGLALARRLQGTPEFKLKVYLTDSPKTEEAQLQYKMAQAVSVPFITYQQTMDLLQNPPLMIIDCLFGTGIYGKIPENLATLIQTCNKADAIRIACDIPSGMIFKAHKTITMGALKTQILTDQAKDFCGQIETANLGITAELFQAAGNTKPDAYLIEDSDIKLPWRKQKSAHKGTYGHTTVFAGEKAGAGVIAATAALNSGSALVTLLKTENTNLNQFKISPELMIADEIPARTTAIVLGCGLGTPDEKTINAVKEWFIKTENPACLLDADMFNWDGLPEFLTFLNEFPSARIILTPHLKEFASLYQLCTQENITVKQLTEGLANPDTKENTDAITLRMKLGNQLCKKYPRTTIIIKSATTVICCPAETTENFICNSGSPSLAKAGSGDVLAGITAALLAQNYNTKDAAITATQMHGLAGSNFSEGTGFDLTPFKLIASLK